MVDRGLGGVGPRAAEGAVGQDVLRTKSCALRSHPIPLSPQFRQPASVSSTDAEVPPVG